MTTHIETGTRFTAHASTEGDPAMLIFRNLVDYPGTDDEYVSWAAEPIDWYCIAVDPETGRPVGLDLTLAEMGYRRVADWESDGSGTGEIATVEALVDLSIPSADPGSAPW